MRRARRGRGARSRDHARPDPVRARRGADHRRLGGMPSGAASMSDVWIIVAVVGVATIAFKAAGPVLIGRRSLPRHVQPVVDLLAPVMLIALVTCADVRWRRGDRGRRAGRRRGRSCDCDRAARARHRGDGDRRAGDCARPSRRLGATRGRSAVPEHGGRRDRLGDEAGEPDHEHPLSKVPHTASFRRMCQST